MKITKHYRLFAAMFSIILLAGCATKWESYGRDKGLSNQYPELWVGKAASNPRLASGMARLVTEFAIFSANVYQPNEGMDYFKLPDKWSMASWQNGKTQVSSRGLAFRVYEQAREDGRKRVVFVFRGTEFFSQDWLSNLGIYSMAGIDDQYLVARKEVEKIISVNYPNSLCDSGYEFYATGHSLGGGLASSIALSFPCIAVVNFNQSMVKAINRINDPYMEAPFLHIHERGEPLDHPRKFIGYGDVRYVSVNLTGVKNPLKNHNMVNMVLGLIGCHVDPPADLRGIYDDYISRNEKKNIGRWLLDSDIKRDFSGCPAETWQGIDVTSV